MTSSQQQFEDELTRALERRAEQLQIPHAPWRAPEQPPARRSRPRGRLTSITAPLPLLLSALVTVGIAAVALTGVTNRHPPGRTSATSSGARSATARPATARAADDSTALLDGWAACERSHGDSNQTDPTVDHAVIYIAVPTGALQNWDPNNASAPCGEYLAAARNAVAGGRPAMHVGARGASAPGWGDNAKVVQYANCMRANGYPTYPYPSGRIEPDGNESTNFNGTGIDPNSPAFLNGNANQMCGKQIGAPAWWINNWGPPGSVDVYPAGANPNSPLPTAPGPLGLKLNPRAATPDGAPTTPRRPVGELRRAVSPAPAGPISAG